VKALVLSVLCLGLTLGVCLIVRRVLDSITAPPQALRPARRSSPAAPCAVLTTELVLQQLARVRTAEGNEAVRGRLVAEFAAGQRDTTLYVAFCPPFERLPDVDTHVTDDTTASVKVAQRLHNGAQLDVRLTEPAENSLTVTVEFFAAEPDPIDKPRPSLAV
jgi:hypothetical protein